MPVTKECWDLHEDIIPAHPHIHAQLLSWPPYPHPPALDQAGASVAAITSMNKTEQGELLPHKGHLGDAL